jgi:hypothetical protein
LLAAATSGVRAFSPVLRVLVVATLLPVACVSTHDKPRADGGDDVLPGMADGPAAETQADRAADSPTADAPPDQRSPDLPPPADGGRPNGEACNGNGECRSGFCADGVCCDKACSETCRACNVANNVGTCTFVVLNKPPRAGQCAPDVANKCGNTGLCDGAGKCQQAEAGAPCGAATCDPTTNLFTPAPSCDGIGVCKPAVAINCTPSRCNAARTSCSAMCTTNDDCVPPSVCTLGSCGRGPEGRGCTSGDQCKSGLCVDHVCCDSACAGQCEACDRPDALGRCLPVTGAPHGARPACGGDAACPGTCDGTNRTKCAYPANRCRSQACSLTASEVIKEAFCDGNGACPPVSTMPCMYACRGGMCTACTPGTRRCNGGTPQLCDADGNWQNVSCTATGNMLPSCNPDGTCGHQCESVGGSAPAPLSCASGNVCPAWAFEGVGTEGWMGFGSALAGTVTVGKKSLAGNTTTMLIAPVQFDTATSRGEVVFQLHLCATGTSIAGKPFSYRIYPEGPGGVFLSVFPRALNGNQEDTPSGLSPATNQWTTDTEGFIQPSTTELQIVVRYNGDWAGTLYLDDIVFK